MSTRVIIDANIFVKDPQVLGTKRDDIALIVLESTIAELRMVAERRTEFAHIVNLVREAAQRGFLFTVAHISGGGGFDTDFLGEFGYADALMIDYARTLGRMEPDQPTMICTEDKKLQRFCLANFDEFTVIDLMGLKSLLASPANLAGSMQASSKASGTLSVDQHLNLEAAKIAASHKKQLLLSMGVGAAIFGLLWLAVINLATINVWGTLLAIPVVGVFLYWFRTRRRLDYAVLELLFGVGSSVSVFLPDFRYDSLDSTGILKIVGGLYIIVRGLDNLGRGLEKTRFEPWWKGTFGG